MELYATVASERGKTVSKGGNEFIRIDLQVEHSDGTREKIPAIWLHHWKSLEGKKVFSVSMTEGNGLKDVYTIDAK